MTCPTCSGSIPVGGVCLRCVMSPQPEVSVASDSLDQLVEQASIPSLADLFRKAKNDGLIAATVAYAN